MKKLLVLLVLVVGLSGDEFEEFSSELETKEVSDPLSGYNRVMTSFNDGAYEYVLRPVASGYRAVVHEDIRRSVSNFFDNLYYPHRFVNNLLQGKFVNAYEETQRFVINSTVGLVGLFDPAKSYFDIKAHDEDFGQTLGFYGVGSGPHIVLPLWGPSNLRDFISMVPDSAMGPLELSISDDRKEHTPSITYTEYAAIKSFSVINLMSLNIDKYDKIKEDAVDLYPYLRDLYEQYRAKQIEE